MFKKNIFLTIPLMVLGLFTGCANTSSEFVTTNKVVTYPREIDSVEYCILKPKQTAICIGFISTNGNGFSDHKDVVKDAKRQAAKMGGDFILEEKSGVETETVLNPGYSSYQANGSAYLNVNQSCIYGSANEQASAFSIGPSVSTYNFPWSVFSVWVYMPSHYGIDRDDNFIVRGFHLNSDAEASGMMIGDKIIGIDGFDISDGCLPQHLMEIQPGDKMVFSISREGKRKDCVITALPNQ